MLPLALVPQPQKTLSETRSMSKSMRYASESFYNNNNVLTWVPDQGRCSQGGSEELDIARNRFGVRHLE